MVRPPEAEQQLAAQHQQALQDAQAAAVARRQLLADADAGRATLSEMRRALLGKKVGDMATVVTPNGKRELEVLKLITIHDAAEEEISDADVAADKK